MREGGRTRTGKGGGGVVVVRVDLPTPHERTREKEGEADGRRGRLDGGKREEPEKEESREGVARAQ